jgi:hypothetical protein
MFNQFRVRYPKGSLISELVTIDRANYVVRSLVVVEGVTLATGLAAAETVEMAEDQARSRALAVLGIHSTTATVAAESAIASPPVPLAPVHQAPIHIPQPTFSPEQLPQASQNSIFTESLSSSNDDVLIPFPEVKHPELDPPAPPVSWDASDIPFADELPLSEDETDFESPTPVAPKPPVSEPKSSRTDKGVSEAKSTSKSSKSEKSQASATPASSNSPPDDFSDLIAKTTVEIKRLKWTDEQGRDYLIRTYGKRGRSLLNDQQLREFLDYLRSQPSPVE